VIDRLDSWTMLHMTQAPKFLDEFVGDLPMHEYREVRLWLERVISACYDDAGRQAAVNDNVTPMQRSARAVEGRWENTRRVELLRGLGFVGTRQEALLAYGVIRADVPPTTCDCSLCHTSP
jgi:hypothetical protein